MSQEDVENAHRAWDAFNRRDLDALLAYMDPEVQFAARFMQMEGRPYLRGHDGIREFGEPCSLCSPTSRSRSAKCATDSMIAALRMSGHGVDSGVAVDEAVWQAAKLRDGRAIWLQTLGSEAEAIEALQAARLSE